MPYSRGEVVIVRFPYSNLKEYKQRPALVVQSDTLVTGLTQRVVAQITKTPRIGTSRVRVLRASPEGASMGLLHDSTIVADMLVTVEDREVAKVIGTCLPTAMTLVDDALRATLDL